MGFKEERKPVGRRVSDPVDVKGEGCHRPCLPRVPAWWAMFYPASGEREDLPLAAEGRAGYS